MKKQLIKSMLTALTFGMLVSLNANATESESDSSIIIGESNHISLTSENAEQNGITAIQLSLLVEPIAEADVSFDFNQENEVKVYEFRYHEDSKILNIYIADAKLVFNDSNLMDLGSVSATDTDGNSVDVEITVVENSLKFVSQNTLIDKTFSVEDAKDTEPITTTTTTETTTTEPITSTTTTTETTTTEPITSTTTTTETTTTEQTISTTETTTTEPFITTEATTTEPFITTETTTTEPIITTETTTIEPIITTETTTIEPIIKTETTTTEPIITTTTTETTTTESITSTTTTETTTTKPIITTTSTKTTTTEPITSTSTIEPTNTECTTTTTLPQTGNNSLKNIFITMASLVIVAYGLYAVKFSGIFRCEKDEK